MLIYICIYYYLIVIFNIFQQGECRIPPPLIQRYSEELKHDLASVCTVLEQVRMHSLTTQHRPVVIKFFINGSKTVTKLAPMLYECDILKGQEN